MLSCLIFSLLSFLPLIPCSARAVVSSFRTISIYIPTVTYLYSLFNQLGRQCHTYHTVESCKGGATAFSDMNFFGYVGHLTIFS